MLATLSRMFCFVTGGHIPVVHHITGPTGDVIKTYRCSQCDAEVTEDTWMKKWRP